MINITKLTVLALAIGSGSLVHGGVLEGSTLRVTHELPTVGAVFGGPLDVVVGPGVEIAGFIGIYSVDLSDTNVFLAFPGSCCGGFGSTPFNGLHLFDITATLG